MNHRDSGLSQQTDVFEEYEERKDNLLDHLVPAQHRSGQPTEVPIRVHNSNDSSLRSMQTACEAAEESYNNRKQWSPEVLNGFNSAFATVIKEQTPSPDDAQKRRDILERLGAIVAAGLDGHTELRVEPYGSFVSGLYCPTGDLDISIEGHVSTRDGRGGRQARDMGKTAKAALLRALSKRLERSRLTSGYIQRILHARVPILKFVWAGSGVPCDVSVGSANSRFKAEVVKVLARMDERFGQMLRLVKVWSGAHGLNDASSGTFNSFALSLMVLFHLQLRQPPVLPPLHELFGDSWEAVSTRPLHYGQEIQPGVLEAFWRRAEAAPRSSNQETLAELLASFFAHFAAAAARWRASDGSCDVRASTWCGAWTQGSWLKSYMAAVEDPFDYMDNCARTIGRERLPHIARSFQEAADVMLSARDAKGVEHTLAWLFGAMAPATLPLGLRTTEDSIGMLNDRDGFQRWRETRRGPLPNGEYSAPTKGGTSQNHGSPHDTRIQGAEEHATSISSSQQGAPPKALNQASAPQAPQLQGTSNARVPPSRRTHQQNSRSAPLLQQPPNAAAAPSQPASFVPPPPPSHNSLPYFSVSPVAAAQPSPQPSSGVETAGAPSRQQPQQQPPVPLSGFVRGGQLSSSQTQQQPEGRTSSDLLQKMFPLLNVSSDSAAEATSAQQPPPAAGAIAFSAASGSAASKAHDHASSSALRQMLKIPGSSGPAPEVHSSGRDLGGSGGRTSAQRRGGGSLGLPDSLDLGTLDLNADGANSAQSGRGAEAGPQGLPQPRPPPKSYKPRKAVPIKAAPADQGAGPTNKPQEDGRRQQAAAPVESAASTGAPGSTASGEASVSKPGSSKKNYRRRHPPRAQARPQDSRTADVSNAQVSGGTPVPAPAKSTAQVVEVRRKFKVKRNDTAAALA